MRTRGYYTSGRLSEEEQGRGQGQYTPGRARRTRKSFVTAEMYNVFASASAKAHSDTRSPGASPGGAMRPQK